MTLSIRRTVTVAASVMLLVGAYVRLYASAWSAGDVIVSISNSSYNVYDHNGIFKETISWASSAAAGS